MNNVAFLGTGLLGSAMVERMLEQGDSVTVWNRTVSKAQALQQAGAAGALTAREAVAAGDQVHLALTDDAVVDSMAARMDDLIAAGHAKDDFAAIAVPVVRAS